MEALYHYFFQQSDERGIKSLKGVRIIGEFNYYKYFWESFGIAPHDMNRYDPEWLKLMAMCGGQESQARVDRMKAKK